MAIPMSACASAGGREPLLQDPLVDQDEHQVFWRGADVAELLQSKAALANLDAGLFRQSEELRDSHLILLHVLLRARFETKGRGRLSSQRLVFFLSLAVVLFELTL